MTYPIYIITSNGSSNKSYDNKIYTSYKEASEAKNKRNTKENLIVKEAFITIR